jgi:Glycosyltransferase family 87
VGYATRATSGAAVAQPALAWPGAWAAALSRWRARLAGSERAPRVALTVMVTAGLALVLLSAQRRSALVPPAKGGFSEWLVGPFRGAASFVPDDPLLDSIAFSSLIAAMFVCWLVVLTTTANAGRRWVLGAIVALHAVLLLGPPLPLTDVFNYVNYARLGVLHGLNPYVDLPASLPGDPSYAYATWHHLLSPYGPLFTLASYGLVPLGLAGGLWTLKVTTVAASAGCLLLVWRLAERRGQDPLWATAFVGLNPLVLIYGVGGVHNDFFMLLAILAGIGALLADRPARGGAALVTAAALKLSGGLVLPFALAGSAPERRRRLAAGATAAGAVLVAASVIAFGPHLPGLETQSTLVTPLSPQNLLGLLLGQGGATAAVRVVVGLGLAATLVALLRATWRGADWLTMAGWATLALVICLTWEMPWYVLWVLPLAALGHSRSLRRATVALTAFLLITLVPITGYVLTHACHCNPSDTKTGKRNYVEIRRHLK